MYRQKSDNIFFVIFFSSKHAQSRFQKTLFFHQLNIQNDKMKKYISNPKPCPLTNLCQFLSRYLISSKKQVFVCSRYFLFSKHVHSRFQKKNGFFIGIWWIFRKLKWKNDTEFFYIDSDIIFFAKSFFPL